MQQRTPSRDVFKPNARVKRAFRGQIVGAFHRCGPNSWDDYAYRSHSGGEILDILPGLRVQVEKVGPRVRIRHHGDVVVVEWQPDQQESAGRTMADLRDHFLVAFLGAEKAPRGRGAAAAIASLLRR